MNAVELNLLDRYLHDSLEPADFEPLQTLLRESAEARRTLRGLATVDAKLAEMAAIAPNDLLQPNLPAVVPAPVRRSGLIAWRPLSGLALGLLIGVAFSSVAWAYAVPRWLGIHQATLLLAESFETGSSPQVAGLPTGPEVWSGDFTAVTGARAGILPAHGNKMLQMLRADYQGKTNSDPGYCGDLFRVVDLRPYREQLASGTVVVRLSAAFNAVPFPESEQYRCSIGIHALTADLTVSPTALAGAMQVNGALAMARQSCPRLDRDPRTWQHVEGSLQLPAETEFLLIHLGVNHIPKFQRSVEFAGHFLDDVQITLSQIQ
ncbi:hypothetical protein ETAA8_19700 [Anatilimnocola aggregata]|uniref:Uncharacterized protein n=1 Tax=Anatilimnocola aggregata TaxID=2528021 RepID=A0A517Y9I8_9BACT|nr:hypothetical protein [Anatilimnocola aggregata]QDU26886.1 hypothetical protein ETAA8_19700 [Anatilimnocola aggregata]